MAGLISINQVLHEKDTGKNLRILYIAPDASSLYWIDLSEKGGMPAVTDLAGVEASILSGERAVSEDIWTTPQTDSEKALARRDSLWQLLGSVLRMLYLQRCGTELGAVSVIENPTDGYDPAIDYDALAEPLSIYETVLEDGESKGRLAALG